MFAILHRVGKSDWVVAIHGMNTTGAWQEAFTWLLSTTWGRSVPVAVYKYGIVIAGVIMAWRRRKLRDNLRDKLAVLREQAEKQGFSGKPDVIAHSFGTWLFGHLLENELERKSEERLNFGRIILTGCILRPDFDWKRIKDAKLVEDVLNHYGTKDRIVPLAHATIWDSGPSGRRGFDSDQVLNICAEGCGHSDLFSISKYVKKKKDKTEYSNDAGEVSYLEFSYIRYWRPFLTLPRKELSCIPDRVEPLEKWRQLPWPFRGTIFPFIALPFTLALMTIVATSVGGYLWKFREMSNFLAGISGVGIFLILAANVGIGLCRRLCR